MKAKDKKEFQQNQRTEKMFFDNRIKRKNVLALNEKVSAIREYEKMPVYKRIGRIFNCSPDQIKRIVQQKDSILKAWEQRTRRCQDAKTLDMKVVRVSMLGKAVYDWIRRMMYYKDFQITDGLIQKMALQFKSAMGLQNFFPHQEWCDKFRQTYKISENDSKLLKIGYSQGYSVQIKDIMKDVLSECTPEMIKKCREVDDGGNRKSDHNKKLLLTTKDENLNDHEMEDMEVKSLPGTRSSSISAVGRPMSQLQPIRQFVAVPIQSNSSGPQKVLVATPIMPPGQGTSPMTMTIIPLSAVAKSQNQPNTTVDTSVCCPDTSCENDKQHAVPPPKETIKSEIKEELPEEMHIKEEIISDDEQDDQSTLQIRTPLTPKSTSINEALRNVDNENVTLSNLQRILERENSHYVKRATSTQCAAPLIVLKSQSTLTSPSPSSTIGCTIPPPPPLTRAPNHSAIVQSGNKRQNEDAAPYMTPIKSCAEARLHLKLLEDFALSKENFRLIGLVSHAVELLCELDGNDDVDID